MIRKNKKLTKAQQQVQYTERDVFSAIDGSLWYERKEDSDLPRRERRKFVRYVLNESGLAPNFMHTSKAIKSSWYGDTVVEIAFLPYSKHSASVDIQHISSDKRKEHYHVAFGPEHSAIVTEVGEAGEPLTPSADPQARLVTTQAVMNRIIDDQFDKRKLA